MKTTSPGERNTYTLLCRRAAELAIIFSVKDQIVNNFGFPGHMIFFSTTEFCLYSMKAAVDRQYVKR